MFTSLEKKKGLSKMERYVAELRYLLIDYSLKEIDPPENLLNELKLAEKLARILLNETESA